MSLNPVGLIGSPPPMRGKAINATKKKMIVRITPAYAGKSCQIQNFQIISRDHPRLCGEKFPYFLYFMTERGSPPPMRGKVPHSTNSGFQIRITPAYAGKRQLSSTHKPKIQGSPPPMRGKGAKRRAAGQLGRITPAYAGKSSFASCSFASFRDHPRLCGEKSATTSGGMSGSGSPPPMRGKVSDVFLQGLYTRITPAYAGKS